MKVEDVPTPIRELYSDDEIEEINRYKIPWNDEKTMDIITVVATWDADVRRINAHRALPWDDHSVWTEHDLAGMMFMREFVADGLQMLPDPLKERMQGYVAVADELFRSFTTEDSGNRMAVIADVEMAGKDWWWFRVPVDGPIAHDLTNYDEHGNYIGNNTQPQ